MSKKTTKKSRKLNDWDAIKREYRAGQLSIREIARKHGISDAAIHNKIRRDKKNGIVWERDLTNEVQARIRTKLVSDEVSNANANEDEIIEETAERGANLIRSHRKDIAALRELETNLIAELVGRPTKLYLSTYRGKIIQKTVSLTASEKSMAANNLANVQHKRIQLERQAFNIDDRSGAENEPDTISITYRRRKPDDKKES